MIPPSPSPQGILFEILQGRLKTIREKGPEMGHPVPAQRLHPLVSFLRSPAVICEIKRHSPSRGAIAPTLDAVEQARLYRDAGVKTISVLTEEQRFGGSLSDLLAIKAAFPDLAVLRKDFLATEEDILVSFRAGADAVLLIAALLDPPTLRKLYTLTRRLGMAALVEVHDRDDVAKVRPLRPRFVGVNCRDLRTFVVDPALPLTIRPLIDWNARVIYESGIFETYQAAWTARAGFQGVLVGEGAVRDRELARNLVQAYRPHPLPSFWSRLFARKSPSSPLVKICGLTREEDFEVAEAAGADLVGFVLAPSPRRVEPRFLRSLRGGQALKVGVIQLAAGEPVPMELLELLEEGSLDALQFHGDEQPSLLREHADHAYKALSPASPREWEAWKEVWPPRFLLDARSGEQRGGTGQRVADELLEGLRGWPLWLAGGLGPDNVGQVVQRWRPELVDASSRLEREPGVKDPTLVLRFVEEVRVAIP